MDAGFGLGVDSCQEGGVAFRAAVSGGGDLLGRLQKPFQAPAELFYHRVAWAVCLDSPEELFIGKVTEFGGGEVLKHSCLPV